MNVAIVGNHNIDLTREIVSKMASFMVVLAEEEQWGSGISIRASRIGKEGASPVEQSAIALAASLALDCYWVRPLNGGRAGTFDRDYSLVESVDRVLAFFRHDRVMEGGTGHVVHAALVRGIPVEAWALTEEGTLDAIGSDEGFEVGTEGSQWMQTHFLAWQAREIEDELHVRQLKLGDSKWSPSLSSAADQGIYVGTIVGTSYDIETSQVSGKISFPKGSKMFLGNSSSVPENSIFKATINTNKSAPPY